MDSIDLRLREVVESAVKSSIDFEKEIELNSSLMDVYQKRKWDLNLSDRQIQIILGMDKKTLMPILDGTAKHVNFINILKLAHFFGLSVNDLMKLYIPQMDSKSIGEIQRSREAGYIIEYFDISTLTKMKFFEKDSSSAEMAKKIQSYFGLDILFDYSKSKTFTAFSRSKRKSDDLMRYFWVQSAIAQFSYINNPYIYKLNN